MAEEVVVVILETVLKLDDDTLTAWFELPVYYVILAIKIIFLSCESYCMLLC